MAELVPVLLPSACPYNSLVSCGGEEPKMSSRELSTAGCAEPSSECVEVIVVAGDAGAEVSELESVWTGVMAQHSNLT